MFQYNEDSHKERGRNGNPGKKGPETREQQRKSQNDSLHQGQRIATQVAAGDRDLQGRVLQS